MVRAALLPPVPSRLGLQDLRVAVVTLLLRLPEDELGRLVVALAVQQLRRDLA